MPSLLESEGHEFRNFHVNNKYYHWTTRGLTDSTAHEIDQYDFVKKYVGRDFIILLEDDSKDIDRQLRILKYLIHSIIWDDWP